MTDHWIIQSLHYNVREAGGRLCLFVRRPNHIQLREFIYSNILSEYEVTHV